VTIALAREDLATARAAADEMAEISARYRTDFTVAAAETAVGWVELREGHATDAAQRLRRAVQAWGALAAPHELATARVHLADAYLASDEPERALLELQAARSSFEQVGATPALRETDARIAALHARDGDEPAPAADRVTRTFVFTDIVDSTRLAEILGDEAWTSLLRWHDQAIRRVVAEHGGEEIKATGDGFFLAFREPDDAIEAMIGVQRRLAAQRDEHGFAPAVRIGAHLAQASRTGLDYLGIGVNYAARIGAAAEGSEILVSETTLAEARRAFARSSPRTLRLHGITEPVDVAAIEWR
jgi:class 3 adenylate cyclase